MATPGREDLAGLRAIVPDLRGHGGSELGVLPVGGFAAVPDAPVLTMKQLAADVLALLDHLKVETAVLVGCSIGGYVLLELWRQAPERISGLVLSVRRLSRTRRPTWRVGRQPLPRREQGKAAQFMTEWRRA